MSLHPAQLTHDFATPDEVPETACQILADQIGRHDFQSLVGSSTDIDVTATADVDDSEPRVTTQLEILTDGGESIKECRELIAAHLILVAQQLITEN